MGAPSERGFSQAKPKPSHSGVPEKTSKNSSNVTMGKSRGKSRVRAHPLCGCFASVPCPPIGHREVDIETSNKNKWTNILP